VGEKLIDASVREDYPRCCIDPRQAAAFPGYAIVYLLGQSPNVFLWHKNALTDNMFTGRGVQRLSARESSVAGWIQR